MKIVRFIGLVGALWAFPATSAPVDAPLRIVMVDVEGGAATMIVTPGGKSVLIDAGWPAGYGYPSSSNTARETSSAQRIVDAAKTLGLRKIDYVVVTHYHLDHVGGVVELLDSFPVGEVIDHGPNREVPASAGDTASAVSETSTSALYAHYVSRLSVPRWSVSAGDQLRIGSLKLDFVASDGEAIQDPLVANGTPPHNCDEFVEPNRDGGVENTKSIGLVATFGKARILSMGDATATIEKKLVCPRNLVGQVDLFIVSHHGSSLSNSPQFLEAVAPRVALLGNGPRKGGDKKVLQTLANAPSHPVVWQVHSATRSPEADRPDDYVANLEASVDGAYPIMAEVWKDGTLRITNGRNGFTQRYQPTAERKAS